MRAAPLLVLLLVAPASAPRAGAPAAARWVDAAAAPGGDGSARRPYRDLADALGAAPGAPLHLRPGRYRLQAPLVLPDGAELRGERAVVEAAGDVPALLDVRGRAAVEGLVLEGGRWALVARGAGAQVALTRVVVRGQAQGGLDAEGGTLVLRDVRLAAAPGGSPLPPRWLERNADAPAPDARPAAASPARTGARPADLPAARTGARHADGPPAGAGVRSVDASPADAGARHSSAPSAGAGPGPTEAPVAGVGARPTDAPSAGAGARPTNTPVASAGAGDANTPRTDAGAASVGVARIGAASAGAGTAGRGSVAWTRMVPTPPLAALRLRAGATADARALTVEGPYVRALHVVQGATLDVRVLRVVGASTALHVNGGRARVRNAQLRGGAGGAGAFVGGDGRLSLESVRTDGFEYAVQGGSGYLEARELSLARPHQAGLALSRTRASVHGLRVEGAGPLGAVQLGQADAELVRVQLLRSAEQGLVVVGGRLVARDVRISDVRASDGEGEGLVVREGVARVEGLEVRGVEGACLHVVEGGRLELRGAQLAGCTSPGVWIERRGRLDATGVHARATPGGPALVVLDRSELRLRASRVDGEVAVDCDGGARAELVDVRGAPGAEGACVTRRR